MWLCMAVFNASYKSDVNRKTASLFTFYQSFNSENNKMVWPFRTRSPSPSSYEKILDSLSAKIRNLETSLYATQTSLRRVLGLLTIYLVVSYTVFLCYVGFARKYQDLTIIVYALIAPFGIYFLRRLISLAYDRQINRKESKLKVLRGQQKAKIEDLKSSMKYYSTKSLLERYDLDDSKSPGLKTNHPSKKADDRARGRQQSLPVPVPTGAANNIALQQMNKKKSAESQAERSISHWYDRILDVIVGEDETSPRNRYALICANCFAHNGLASPGQTPDIVQYICPACGTWNSGSLPVKEEGDNREDDELKDIETNNSVTEQLVEPESTVNAVEKLIEAEVVEKPVRRRRMAKK
ncbi:hypothetical protein V1512DRAFT_230568 [Lipomyces arxii]|uniref:uncharacterized protein n=1 Tax=Lipomyces arxii TaxID=56418 RepID=UPI0034CFFAA1